MPPKKRPQNTTSTNVVYKPAAAAASLQQRTFSTRRKSVRTYGRPKSSRKMKQETLTQMNFTSSVVDDAVDLGDDDDDDDVVVGKAMKQEDVDLEPSAPVENIKSRVKPRNNRRKTEGDALDIDEMPRRSKRRKTLGDSPSTETADSLQTQTLTQMVSAGLKDDEIWQIKDSDDDEDFKLVPETPKKSSERHTKNEAVESTISKMSSLIKPVTPANRQKKIEIPSSQTPTTPMLLRYSPAQHSPLDAKSTNLEAFSSILKNPSRTPMNAVIPDSFSTAHESSAVKSTVKATPHKKISFDLPSDKENITPGRKKPKSPKIKTLSTGRQPLQEVPDSDDDLDETEYETSEDDGEGAYDPESPSIKRFYRATPQTKNPESQKGSPEITHGPSQEETESVMLTGIQPLVREQQSQSSDKISSVPDPGLDFHPETPNTILDGSSKSPHVEVAIDHHAANQDPVLEPGASSETEAEVATPRPHRKEQGTAHSTLASEKENNRELSSPGQSGNHPDENSLPWQDCSSPYTQGLESQRLPLASIHSLGPQTRHSDIMVSLHPEHIAKIVDRTKNHEFRVWKIPPEASRIWIYITRPQCQLKYMCLFGEPKLPGEVQDEKGIGNVDFNQGKMAAKYAYEILQVYELNNPVSLDEMKKKGWVNGPPQKYTYIPPAVVGEITANLRCALFEDVAQPHGESRKGISESQELKAQLRSEVGYSARHYSGASDEVVPASPTPRKNEVKSAVRSREGTFAKPALSRTQSISANHDSPSLPNLRQGNAVRPSQATTVSHVSSSPAITPEKSGPRPIFISSDPVSSPTTQRRTRSSLQSPRFPTRSQMLPESLLNKDIRAPPDIIWDSADDNTD